LDCAKQMTKEQLIDISKKLLKTDSDLEFLSKLSNFELETLVALMRDRIENPKQSWTRLINACKYYPDQFSG